MCFSFSVLPPSERRESPLDCSSATTVSTADASTPPEAASTALRLWFWQTRPLVGEEGSPLPTPPQHPPTRRRTPSQLRGRPLILLSHESGSQARGPRAELAGR